jgi:hypothetical protein
MTVEVLDRRPPDLVVRVLNVPMRVVLRSRLGRLIGGLAELDFEGRRTGERRRVVVGWHELEGRPVVLTPARWRANFADGHAVRLWHQGRATEWLGSLVTDPSAVADAMNALIRAGTTPSAMGLRIAPGHEVSAADVVDVHRAVVRFAPA